MPVLHYIVIHLGFVRSLVPSVPLPTPSMTDTTPASVRLSVILVSGRGPHVTLSSFLCLGPPCPPTNACSHGRVDRSGTLARSKRVGRSGVLARRPETGATAARAGRVTRAKSAAGGGAQRIGGTAGG